jgi:alpha-tubulin suppressor-like RCC1 family protein
MSQLLHRWVAMGYNAGQLGIDELDDRIFAQPVPCTSLYDRNVIQISTGRNHTLALTSSGQVYSFGINSHGQLGLGDRHDRIEPTLIKMLTTEKIVQVCASCDYSVVLNGIVEIYNIS